MQYEEQENYEAAQAVNICVDFWDGMNKGVWAPQNYADALKRNKEHASEEESKAYDEALNLLSEEGIL